MTYTIWYQYPGQPAEEIDEVETVEEKNLILREYRLAFRGQAGTVWARKKKDNPS